MGPFVSSVVGCRASVVGRRSWIVALEAVESRTSTSYASLK
jgi:hypothetical protein